MGKELSVDLGECYCEICFSVYGWETVPVSVEAYVLFCVRINVYVHACVFLCKCVWVYASLGVRAF